MKKILALRGAIYDRFHSSSAGPDYFFKKDNNSIYAGYYTSMYLIADTGEAVYSHLEKDFSKDSMLAYIEFWGVMQAIVIQQDAIGELYLAVFGKKLANQFQMEAWSEIRLLRNICAGHPSNQGGGRRRAFMARGFGKYDQIQYELFDSQNPDSPTFPHLNLRKLINRYDDDGAEIMKAILAQMILRWP